jgi:methylated-DNA-[protein]-cysteine S-methyltransferase
MTEQLFFTAFYTSAGWIALLGSSVGLIGITLPRGSRKEAVNRLGSWLLDATESPRHFQATVNKLVAYFNGNQVDFTETLDLKKTSAFQRKVWQATSTIPYGETRSYSWVAKKINRPKAVRAVGQALGRNPLPVIIPCHRVLASNGGMGGYTGGLDMKKFLLALERKSRQ